MQAKDLQPRLLYPAKLSFRMGEQMKCFPDKVKFKEFHLHQALIWLKGLTKIEDRRSKTMNSKMTPNSQLSTTEPKKKPQKTKAK